MDDFTSKKRLPLVDLSQFIPEPAILGYEPPNPEVEKAKQEATEAKKKYLLNQKPEEAVKHVRSGQANLESVYSAFCLLSYLFEEHKILQTKKPNQYPTSKASNNNTKISKWDAPVTLKEMIFSVVIPILCLVATIGIAILNKIYGWW